MGSTDASFNGSVFHKNYPQIIASDRALAKLISARFAWQSTSIVAGTVVARRTSDGFYVPYNDATTGGPDTAVGVTLEDLNFDSSATGSGASGQYTQIGRVCVGGATLYYDKLTGLDANGLTDIHGRKVTDAAGTNLLEF